MSPGSETPPGPQHPPKGDPPSAPVPADRAGTRDEGRASAPQDAADPASTAPGRSRSARRRARRRAARRAAGAPGSDTTGSPEVPDGPASTPPAGTARDAAPDATAGPAADSASAAKPVPRPPRPAGARQSGAPRRGERSRGPRAASASGQATPEVPRRGRRAQQRARWLRQVEEFSAGGLVLDLNGEQPRGALIGRTDRQGRLLWSLPKGHIEAGETAEQAALREVEEETGIAGTILGELGTIDFWFVADGRRIHKTVRHYLMRRVGGELSDADIEVDEVAWVPFAEIRAQLAYPDERGLVDTAGRMLADTA